MDTQIVILSPAERVAAGMAWIDENAERLNLDLSRVDVDTLELYTDDACVLAQAGARTFTAIMTNGGPFLPDSYNYHVFGAMGLDHYDADDGGDERADHEAVRAAWVEAITARRTAEATEAA